MGDKKNPPRLNVKNWNPKERKKERKERKEKIKKEIER
jgi:hypothetical protein